MRPNEGEKLIKLYTLFFNFLHEVVHFKHVLFTVCQLYPNKAVFKKARKQNEKTFGISPKLSATSKLSLFFNSVFKILQHTRESNENNF